MKTRVGATRPPGYHANYVGGAPGPEPAVGSCVRITHEPTSPRVARAARRVLAEPPLGAKAHGEAGG